MVLVVSRRSEDALIISVTDNGGGLHDGKVGDGLGTQIVRTLVDGELGGSIAWNDQPTGGTEVRIAIPLQFLTAVDSPVALPSV